MFDVSLTPEVEGVTWPRWKWPETYPHQGSKWAIFFLPGPAQAGPKNDDARPAQTGMSKAQPGPAQPLIDARPARPIGPDYKVGVFTECFWENLSEKSTQNSRLSHHLRGTRISFIAGDETNRQRK